MPYADDAKTVTLEETQGAISAIYDSAVEGEDGIENDKEVEDLDDTNLEESDEFNEVPLAVLVKKLLNEKICK
ncbi:hypothetical protein FQR65_LT00738 [Abscondita terminalis]|nr:hypothetical protein FQR65_LT00738 [Abscondita terminalis]